MERPKRRKYRDNPYTLEFKENKYYIRFKDITNNIQIVEVSEEVYKIFDKSELEDISQMHEYERHIEHSELTDITLNRRAKNKSITIEEEIENSKKALQILKGKIENIENFTLPFTDYGRNVVLVRKIGVTPKNYPRKQGKPAKEPIG